MIKKIGHEMYKYINISKLASIKRLYYLANLLKILISESYNDLFSKNRIFMLRDLYRINNCKCVHIFENRYIYQNLSHFVKMLQLNRVN